MMQTTNDSEAKQPQNEEKPKPTVVSQQDIIWEDELLEDGSIKKREESSPINDSEPAEQTVPATTEKEPEPALKPQLRSDQVHIELSPDKCTLSMSTEVERETLPELREYVEQHLKKIGCRRIHILQEAMATFDKAVAEATKKADELAKEVADQPVSQTVQTVKLEKLVLLTGVLPVKSQDAYLDWAKDFFSQALGVDPDVGKVDYRERGNNLSVYNDQLLATLHPAIPGTHGQDVFGNILAVKPPQKSVRLRIGKNIRFDAQTGNYYAATKGRLRFVNHIMAVDDVFTIPGSVGIATGNVNHPGALIVRENVESESRVEADGDIEIHGYVENAVIICGGNLLIKGGVTGMDGYVRAGGEIHAHYIQNAEVEAGGDVVVDREISQSNIRSRGRVIVKVGRIVGGEISALRGIESDYLGSDAGILTTVATGDDFQLEELLEELDSQKNGYEEMKHSLDKKMQPFLENEQNLPTPKKNILQTLKVQSEELQRRIIQTESEINVMREEFEKNRCLEVLIRKEVASDCVFQIAGLTLRSQDTLYGPLKVCARNGKILCVGTRL